MNKILVVDDDSAINELIKVNLELHGYKVYQAFDGTDNNLSIFVPINAIGTYKNAEGWSDYADRIGTIKI